jgi:hypothetical protein
MAPPPHVLLLGGHGKISLLLTPLLLAKSYAVTSVIRNPSQQDEILALGKNQPGKIDVLIESLDDVKEASQAQKVIDRVKPNWVVWSAGAGGKGGKERTNAVDCVAAKAVCTPAPVPCLSAAVVEIIAWNYYWLLLRLLTCVRGQYISASLSTPTIIKFLMVSYIASRRGYPSWWNDEDRAAANKVNTEILPAYYQAKVAADEHLAALAHNRGKGFQAINLRPGTLKDGAATGKVNLGKCSPRLLGWILYTSLC